MKNTKKNRVEKTKLSVAVSNVIEVGTKIKVKASGYNNRVWEVSKIYPDGAIDVFPDNEKDNSNYIGKVSLDYYLAHKQIQFC